MSAPDKNKVHFLKFGAHRSVQHATGWFGLSKLRHPALARQHLLHALMHRRDECGRAGITLGDTQELPSEDSEGVRHSLLPAQSLPHPAPHIFLWIQVRRICWPRGHRLKPELRERRSSDARVEQGLAVNQDADTRLAREARAENGPTRRFTKRAKASEFHGLGHTTKSAVTSIAPPRRTSVGEPPSHRCRRARTGQAACCSEKA